MCTFAYLNDQVVIGVTGTLLLASLAFFVYLSNQSALFIDFLF